MGYKGIVRDDIFDNWPSPTPEEKLMKKEEDHTKPPDIDYVYDLLSCLTLRDIKILCLRGKISPFEFLDPNKIKYKVSNLGNNVVKDNGDF